MISWISGMIWKKTESQGRIDWKIWDMRNIAHITEQGYYAQASNVKKKSLSMGLANLKISVVMRVWVHGRWEQQHGCSLRHP